MSVIQCARTAAAVGRLNQQDRKAMERLWAREHEAAVRAGGGTAYGNANAIRVANQAVHQAMVARAQHLQRVAQLTQAAQRAIEEDWQRYRNFKGQPDIGDFVSLFPNLVHDRSNALFRMDMAEISSLLAEYRKTLLGTRMNKVRMELVVREIFGIDTGDATAKAHAQAWTALIRRKVDQFNAAGGNIAFRKDWHLPQIHDALAVARAGFDEWRAFIMARIDQSQMINPITGKQFSAAELEEFVQEAYGSILYEISSEAPSLNATQRGRVAWRSRSDPRMFIFKDADAWLEYSQRFGGGQNPFETMTGYLRTMNHDIAAMQMLGPNPNAMFDWMTQQVTYHARLAETGKPSLFPPENSFGKKFTSAGRIQYAKDKVYRAQRAWDVVTGEANRAQNLAFAQFESTIDNIAYANMLPFTVTLMGGDLVNQAMTRAFRGMGVSGMFRDLFEALRTSTDPEELAELGIEIDVGLSIMNGEARESAAVMGHPISQALTDRIFTATGMKPLTMGMRGMFQLGVLHEVTRNQRKAWGDLNPRFREFLEDHDIGPDDWAVIQVAPLHARSTGKPIVTPTQIATVNSLSGVNVRARPGLTVGQEVAVKLQTAINAETEYAVVSGTPRSKSVLSARPGTIPGSALSSLARLKSYAISHMQHHGHRAAQIYFRNGRGIFGTLAAARYYAIGLLFPSMALVAAGTAIAEILKGRDPPDVTDPAFWNQVFWKTVSLGFYQDIVRAGFDTENPFATGGQLLGPRYALYAQAGTLLGGVSSEALDPGNENNTVRDAIRLGKRVVPRHWATDISIERLAWDNIQRAVDPEAEEDFARRARRMDYWYEPGAEGAPWEQEPIDWSAFDFGDQDGDYTPQQ